MDDFWHDFIIGMTLMGLSVRGLVALYKDLELTTPRPPSQWGLPVAIFALTTALSIWSMMEVARGLGKLRYLEGYHSVMLKERAGGH